MVDLNKGATVELVKTLSDDIRTLPDGTKAASAGAALREQITDFNGALKRIVIYHGKGNVYSDETFDVGLKSGNTYRVYVNKWDATGITTTSGNLFRLGYKIGNDSTFVYNIYGNDSSVIAEYYDIVIPDGVANPLLLIGGRATGNAYLECDNAYLISNVEQNRANIDNLYAALQNDFDKTHFVSTFNVMSGKAHSALNDRIYDNYKKGSYRVMQVEIDTPSANTFQLIFYGFESDSSSGKTILGINYPANTTKIIQILPITYENIKYIGVTTSVQDANRSFTLKLLPEITASELMTPIVSTSFLTDNSPTTSNGYISNTGNIVNQTSDKEVYTKDYYPCENGTALYFSISFSNSVSIWLAIALYDGDKQFLSRVIVASGNSTTWKGQYVIDNTNAKYFRFTYRTFDAAPDVSVSYLNLPSSRYIFSYLKDIRQLKDEVDTSSENSVSNTMIYLNKNIRVINHRGFNTVAPENTLPAFKLSREKLFQYVETDISFTSDSVPVLLHDDAIDRTSNGTGNVSDYTYEQLLQYDFGSWKNASYTGTKIPKLEEFVILCKRLGLHPYIELKTDSAWTAGGHAQIIANTVIKAGMKDNVTFISFTRNYLDELQTIIPKARYGYLCGEPNMDLVEHVKTALTNGFDCFIDAQNIYCVENSESVTRCVSNGVPLEVWTVDSNNFSGLSNYITGYTVDSYDVLQAMYNSGIS